MVWMVRSQFPAETGSPFSDKFPDQLWDPLSFLYNGKIGLFPQEAKQAEKDNAHTFLYYAKV
jgi:hypothetical protein